MCSFPRSCAVLFLSLVLPIVSAHGQRQMEKLGRGVVAIRTSSTQVYVGWRLLGNDPEDIGFNLYRASASGTTQLLTNFKDTTNYVDTPPSLSTTEYSYYVKPVVNGVEVPDVWANPLSGPAQLPINAPTRQYIPVALQPTPDDAAAGVSYDVKFCWVGDFDGDGEYDYLIDRSNPNVEAKQWLQAYKRDGTLLWKMDMGPNSVDHYNITPGSSSVGIGHGDNVTVYDLDGDGKAEVIVRTANGVVFANGTTLTAPDNEVQYISIIDGMTGQEKARATVPIPAAWATKTHMNGQMGIVYADGIRPSLFFHPSNRNADSSFNKYAATWDYRNGALTQRWIWLESGHTAEGHQVRLADVDNDGKDEYVDIGNVVKSDGSGQINEAVLTEVVHGDRFHVTDIDPDHPGLETFLIQQNNGTGLATAYHAADKSAVLKKWYAGGVVDVGRGTVGAFVPGLQGLQFFSTQPGVFDCKGNQIYDSGPFPPETIWWDGDLGREFVSTIGSSATSPGIDKFNTANGSTSRLLTIYSDPQAPNSPYNNYIAYGGRPQFWGDILGDWREELICVASDNSELRIYTTKTADSAKTGGGMPFRIYTLMHNPQYRIQATTKGYVQSSYVDYYLGYNMPPPPPPPMVDAKLVWRGGAGATTWDLGTTQSWLNSGANSTFSNGDTVRFDTSGNNTTAVSLNGTLQPGALTVYNPKDYTFTGTGTLAGTMKLTKSGAGALILPGTHTFSGKTTVWDGALVVNGNLQNSPVVIWGGTWGGALAAGKTGGRIGGVGNLSQPVTIKYRGAITPGAGMNSAGILTFANGLTAEDGATFALDLSDDPTGASKPSDRIAVTGNLTLTGTTTILINPLNGTIAAGTYTLATYTGTLTGGLSNLVVALPAGTPYTLSASGGAIKLTVPTTRPAASVIWRGGGGNWDLASSQNWLRAGLADVFVSGDSVAFDASGAASPTVTLTTVLPVAGVTVNASTDYTFTGAGYLAGTGSLTKSGTGTLTINTNNTYTGPTIINGGVLAVDELGDAGSPSAIGASDDAASNFVLNGGTLRLTGLQTNMNRKVTLGASGGSFDIALANSSIQVSGVFSGNGALTKSGPGTLLLANANTYTGGTIINGGKVYLAGSTANENGLGTGNVTINNGTLSMADVEANDVANWNLIVPTSATARLNADGRCGLYGSLTGGGDFTYYSPYIRTDLHGNWSAFTGRINVVGGDFRIANTSGYANTALDIGAGGTTAYVGYILTVGSSGVTVDIGELAGSSTGTLGGGPTSGRTLTWRVGNKNTSSTFAGVAKDGTGPTALTKVGTGTLTLTGANTYTGATTVSAGKLALNGGSLTSSVTVASGAGFGGNGSVTGNVTFNSGSVLLGNPVAGPLTITGNLSFGGPVTVSPIPGAVLSGGTYPLYTYSSTLTGTPSFTWAGSGFTATFNTSVAGQVSMTLVELPRDPGDIVWTGAQSTDGQSAVWDSSTKNWSWTIGATAFLKDDRAHFGDSSAVTAVTLSGSLEPASVTVDATHDYTLAGTGTISGAATVTKAGTGNLTLSNNANNYSGGTTISGGTLILGSGVSFGTGGIGAGGVIFASGTLSHSYSTSNTLVYSNVMSVASGQTGTIFTPNRFRLNGAVTGAGTLNMAIATTVSRADFQNNFTGFTGDLNLTGSGTIRLGISSLGTGQPLFDTAGWASATLGVDGVTVTPTITSGRTILIGALTSAGTAGTLGGGTGGTAIYSIGAKNLDTTYSGKITGNAAVTKTGTGMLNLSGANTYTGATTVSSGTLLVTGTLGSTTTSVSSGATIGGTGTLGGKLTLASGARLALGVGASATKGLTVSGTITLNGVINVVPALLGGTLAPGTYTLLTYTGTLGGSPTFTWNDTTSSGYVAIFDTSTAGQVKITLAIPPAAPSGLVATPGNGQIGLAWNAVSGATSYTVRRSTISGSGYVEITPMVTTNSYVNGSLANGTTYYYVVVAKNAVGLSGNSNEATGRPTAPISAQEQRAPAVGISGPDANGASAANLTVNASVVGHTYQLQYCDDLSSAIWRNYGSAVLGTGGPLPFTMPVDTTVPHRFYRVAIEP